MSNGLLQLAPMVVEVFFCETKMVDSRYFSLPGNLKPTGVKVAGTIPFE